MSLNIPWWNYNYRFRKQVTLTANGSVVIPNPSIAMISLSGYTSLMRGDRNDVRIVRWNGSSWSEKEVYRYSDTQFYFKTTDSVASGNSDDAYYVYYGFASAGTPPGTKNSVFPPYLDNQSNSLYFLDSTGEDYANGQLTPDDNLTNVGAVTYTDGPYYQAAVADGTTSAVLWNQSSDAGAWGNSAHPLRNMEMWLYPVSSGLSGTIIAYYRNGGSDSWQKIKVRQEGTALFVQWGTGSSLSGFQFASILTVNEWHHYGFRWYQSPDILRAYKDGVFFGEGGVMAYPQPTATNAFTSLFAVFNGSAMEDYWQGRLYGLKFGRNNGAELDAHGFSLEHGKRSLLPTATLGLEEQPAGGSFLYRFL